MTNKQGIISAIAGATFCYLTNPTNGAIFTANASANTNCSLATQSDTCIFHCDEEKEKRSFDCEDAGQCDIFCEKKECLQYGTIDASNANQGGLNLITNKWAVACAGYSNIHLPTSD